ncbi:rifin PIR protein,putative [Plasmodium sp. DRC-Itaito]|nr:rifin PIR protein,putative [Plasmodium sp. DRC-Itaito]
MKLHYYNILLFFCQLNILVTSYQEHNKNKPYITTHHTATTKSRVLSKYDIQSSIYHNDRDIKSVKENFDRQTSQRLREYEERMKVKRQKRKAKRDKNIQKIIEKDKMETSLAEKVEKRCLKYGCGLGGVAASVGLFGGFGIYGWKTVALAAAKNAAIAEVAEAGKNAVILGITTEFGVSTLGAQPLETVLNVIDYTDVSNISHLIYSQYETTCISIYSPTVGPEPICFPVWEKLLSGFGGQGEFVKEKNIIETAVRTIVSNAKAAAGEAEEATTLITTEKIGAIDAISSGCQIAIIASVVAILIIALVMIIIYLVLRYRREKKMNKKADYTKLLNQ